LGGSLSGGNGGDGGVTGFVPNFYYSRKMTERFAVGIGVNAPFGLATDYDKDWVGRYHAVESDLLSVNINPSIAYKFNEHLSVGVGASAQYIKAKLSNAIDFGTLDAAGELGLPPGALGLIPQGADGFGELEGDSWGFGFNVGILYEFTKDTRIGLAYRSRIDHNVEGEVDYSNVPAGLAGIPIFTDDGDAEADITLPDSLSFSVFHQISPEWIVMADVTWTNWQLFDELKVEFDDSTPDSVTTENWRDSYRYSLGVTYLPSKNLALRLGTAYDTSAVSDKRYRTPRIPDGDRIWTTAGLGYRISDMFSFDIGYAHLFINDPEISKTPTGEDAVKGGLNGKFDASTDIISAQLNIAF
jgi:long-chain fatty acid transport protein